MTTTAMHWIRILPTGEREIWQTMKPDAPSHPSQVMCCSMCPSRTWWAPLTDDGLLDAVAYMSLDVTRRLRGEPCLCVAVKDVDGALQQPEVVDMSDQGRGRPFMARFSWTVGLPWDPPVTVREVDGSACIFDGDKKIATAKAGMSCEAAMHELRVLRY